MVSLYLYLNILKPYLRLNICEFRDPNNGCEYIYSFAEILYFIGFILHFQPQQKGKQGTKGAKQIAEENVATLKFYRNLAAGGTAVFLAVTFLLFDLTWFSIVSDSSGIVAKFILRNIPILLTKRYVKVCFKLIFKLSFLRYMADNVRVCGGRAGGCLPNDGVHVQAIDG